MGPIFRVYAFKKIPLLILLVQNSDKKPPKGDIKPIVNNGGFTWNPKQQPGFGDGHRQDLLSSTASLQPVNNPGAVLRERFGVLVGDGP